MRRKLPVVRGKSSKGSSTARVALRRKERLVVVTDFDDDDNVPIAQRRRRLFQDNSNSPGEQLNKDAKPLDVQ
ncbi:hypothetical protein AHAS_Ahas01G0292300 [Arachis hypogaea]